MVAIYAVAIVGVIAVIALGLKGTMADDNSQPVPDSTGDSTPVSIPATTDSGDVVNIVTDMLKGLEGFSQTRYEDPPGSGKYSIGYGHQIQPGENFPQYISEDAAIGLLARDVSLAWGCVRQKVKVSLTVNQGAALTSFCYNVGCSAFGKSTMLRILNLGDYTGAAQEFNQWIYSNGSINNVLVARRQQETDLFEA